MLKLFDPIANLNPIPAERLTLLESEYQGIQTLPIGQVGTIVENVVERSRLGNELY